MPLPDNKLQRIQLWVAIMAGVATFIVAAYNIKNIFFSKKEEPAVSSPKSEPDPVGSAIKEVGAEWIKKLGKPKSESGQ